MATKRRASASPAPAAAPTKRIYPTAGPASAHKRLRKSDPGHEDQLAQGPPEKRLKQFKRACPQATRERADRVFAQRFFCVARERTTGEKSEQFKVLGSTGNRYTVTIDKVPSCDCPDGSKGNTCKHRLFVLLKILEVPQASNLWYQSALLSSELAAIFANARAAPRTAFEEGVVRRYQVATGVLKPEELDAESSAVEKRIPDEGDSCPICYEDYTPGSEEGLLFCRGPSGCGNPLHQECFQNWARTSHPTTCPLCRQKWTDSSSATQGGNAHAGPSYTAEGYENYAAMAGISTKRDTSSYHQGPRRGRDGRWRFGYDDDSNHV